MSASRAPFEPAGFSGARQAHLAALEGEHFWFPPRDELIRKLLATLLPDRACRLLELGCGSGRFLSNNGLDRHSRVGVEAHARFLEIARERSADVQWIHADVAHVPLAKDCFDLTLALDVLEHVEPQSFLREAFRVTRPGGYLLLTVPAHAFLYSEIDAVAGHRCRYSVRLLRRELGDAGWCPERHTYYQRVLLPLLAASRLWNRRRPPELERRPPVWLNRLLGRVNRLDTRWLGTGPFPPGTSLVLWAHKPKPRALDAGAGYQRRYYQAADHARIQPSRSPYTQRHLREVLETLQLESGSRVLEVGAGLGRFSELLREQGLNVVATDLSPEHVAELDRREPTKRHHVCDAADVAKLGYAPFDAVVGFFLLHHLDDVERVFRGVFSALRPGGQVAFCEPNAFHLPFYAQILLARDMTWRGDGGVRRMRRTLVEPAMTRAGFREVSTRRYGFVPRAVANHSSGRRFERALESHQILEPLRAFQMFMGRRPRQ